MSQQSESKKSPSSRGPLHDRFFKSHFDTPDQVRSLLTLALSPSQLKLFDLDTIALRKSVLPDAAVLREHQSELVIEVGLRGGDEAVIGILIEHKSGRDRGLMRQLLAYMARLYDRKTPVVLPITIYHGRSRWRREKSFHAFEHSGLPESFQRVFAPYLIDFRTIFVSLREDAMRRQVTRLPLKERLITAAPESGDFSSVLLGKFKSVLTSSPA